MARAALPGPAFLKRLQALLGTRAGTIKAWRRGDRKPPQWALDTLYEACSRIRNTANSAMELEQARAKKEAAEAAP